MVQGLELKAVKKYQWHKLGGSSSHSKSGYMYVMNKCQLDTLMWFKDVKWVVTNIGREASEFLIKIGLHQWSTFGYCLFYSFISLLDELIYIFMSFQ